MQTIPEQCDVPWSTALQTSAAGLRRRLGRSCVTMLGVVLAIALLSYMLVTSDMARSMLAANDPALNSLLQKSGVDILNSAKRDPMMLLLVSLSLVTCLVGIVNSMMMSVSERLKEIGTLKCLGATDGFIVRIYFIESLIVGVVGTLCGMVGGVVVAFAVLAWSYGTFAFRCLPVVAVGWSLLLSLIAGVVISVLAAIAPAIWASKQEPVNAMRIEE